MFAENQIRELEENGWSMIPTSKKPKHAGIVRQNKAEMEYMMPKNACFDDNPDFEEITDKDLAELGVICIERDHAQNNIVMYYTSQWGTYGGIKKIFSSMISLYDDGIETTSVFTTDISDPKDGLNVRNCVEELIAYLGIQNIERVRIYNYSKEAQEDYNRFLKSYLDYQRS